MIDSSRFSGHVDESTLLLPFFSRLQSQGVASSVMSWSSPFPPFCLIGDVTLLCFLVSCRCWVTVVWLLILYQISWRNIYRNLILFFLLLIKIILHTCWSARCARSGLVVSNSIIFFRFIVKFIKKSLYSGYIRISCYFGLFWVISGSIRVSIGGFVKRVISGYSRESCYLGHFRSF